MVVIEGIRRGRKSCGGGFVRFLMDGGGMNSIEFAMEGELLFWDMGSD
jgi:hypothetical protein